MGKWLAVWSVVICCSLTSVAHALTVDDYVIAGRRSLFEGTVTGLAQARDIFEAGISDTDCPDCPDDRDLLFLYAVARTALVLIEHSAILNPDGLFELAEEFGVPLAAIVFCESPEGDSQGAGRRLWRVDADPRTIQQILRDTILPELAEVVATLDAVDDGPVPFVMYLTPRETGLTSDLEIDYGDVLALKSLLLAYQAQLTGQLASAVDDEAGGLAVDGKATGLFDTPRGHLPSPACPTRPEGPKADARDCESAMREQARQDWRQAVQWYLDAVDHIAGEDYPPGTDPQTDEFVYIDPDSEPRLGRLRRTLVAGDDSFLWGSPGGPRTETYDVCDAKATPLGRLTLICDTLQLEGHGGRMVLTDGSALEVEWFGVLDEGQVGVSLFAADGTVEGWFEGTVAGDRTVISDGMLDLWSASDAEVAAQGPYANRDALVSLESTLKWSKAAWDQLRRILTPAAIGQAVSP